MEVFSTCVRLAVLTVSYYIYDMLFMNYMLVRRRSQNLRLIVCAIGLLTKNIVITYLLPNSRLDEQTVMEIQFIYAVSFSVITYAVLRYTFQGSVLKLGLFQIIVETNQVFFMATILPLINWAEGRNELGSVGGPFQFPDLLMIPVIYGLLQLEFYLLKPWRFRIRNYEPRHRKVMWGVVAAYLTAGIGSTFSKYAERGMFHSMVRTPAVILFIPGCAVCVYMYVRYRAKTKRTNAYSHAQKELMDLHYSSVKRQIRKMEQEQNEIDAQMQEITALAARKEAEGSRGEDYEERIQNYLRTLKHKFNEMQAGIYCADYLVDSVLCYMAEMCRKKKIKATFAFQKYDRGTIPENELAEILFQILDYCIRESNTYNEKQSLTPSIFLCAAGVKNLLLLEFSCCSVKSGRRIRRELKRTVTPLLIPYHGEIEIEDGNEKKFCVRMQRG